MKSLTVTGFSKGKKQCSWHIPLQDMSPKVAAYTEALKVILRLYQKYNYLQLCESKDSRDYAQ
jgi:hypothetical protein